MAINYLQFAMIFLLSFLKNGDAAMDTTVISSVQKKKGILLLFNSNFMIHVYITACIYSVVRTNVFLILLG